MLGIAVGGFGAGVGGGLAVMAPTAAKAPEALPMFIDIETNNAGKFLVCDGDKVTWVDAGDWLQANADKLGYGHNFDDAPRTYPAGLPKSLASL